MHHKSLLALLICTILIFYSCGTDDQKIGTKIKPKTNVEKPKKAEDDYPVLDTNRIIKEANKLKIFLQNNTNYNQEIVMIADMKIFSGYKRFVTYNLITDKIINFGHVAHGSNSEINSSTHELCFSNVQNSNQTSLGKYKIGNSYIGEFGKAYKLYGLDASNSNAFARFIVLHSYGSMFDIDKKSASPRSLGCPMVAKSYFAILEKQIDASRKPILLDIIY
jgi:L,D-transpeptidase catalytic domain